MIATYCLTCADRLATEDTVPLLQDAKAPSKTATAEEVEKLVEKEYGITRLVTDDVVTSFACCGPSNAISTTICKVFGEMALKQ